VVRWLVIEKGANCAGTIDPLRCLYSNYRRTRVGERYGSAWPRQRPHKVDHLHIVEG